MYKLSKGKTLICKNSLKTIVI